MEGSEDNANREKHNIKGVHLIVPPLNGIVENGRAASVTRMLTH